jgi:hypothetical protein
MPRIPRKFVFDPTEVGVYHCINRCVRRAFLCGTDSLTGKCFDHRKEWIQERLGFLAGNLGVDIPGFSIMSNHLHVVVRNRPEYLQLLDWTGREVRADTRGSIPADLAPVLERLHMSGESWLNPVHDFRRKVRRAVGTPESLRKVAQKRGCRKMQGIQHSRAIFDPPAPHSIA